MSPAITLQVIKRAIALILIFSFEVGGELGLIMLPDRYPALASKYSMFALGFGYTCMCFAFIWRLDQSALMRDMREIFMYDILIQLYGACSSWTGYGNYGSHVLVNAVLLLKLSRILWFDTKATAGKSAGWPVFGLLGWYAQRTRPGPVEAALPYLQRHRLVYLNIAACVGLAWVLKAIGLVSLTYLVFCAVPVVLIGLYYKKFIKYLEDDELARIRTNQELAVAKVMASVSQELKEKNDLLIAANRERDVMLADLTVRNEYLRDASHDLAAPAFWITSCAQQLASASDEADRATLAERLLDSVAYYNQLLQATIHSAKIITKIEQPVLRNIPVNRIADYLWEKYMPIFEEKGVRFGIYKANQYVLDSNGEVTPDINPERAALKFHVVADEYILMRILNNLIMNALRNTTQGRVRVAFRKRRNGVCWIEVHDTGNGFEEADSADWSANFDMVARRIRTGRMTASETASHGLGINNIRNLCTSIQSNMTLYSRVGAGSIFRFVVALGDGTQPPEEPGDQLHYYA